MGLHKNKERSKYGEREGFRIGFTKPHFHFKLNIVTFSSKFRKMLQQKRFLLLFLEVFLHLPRNI